MNSRPANQIWLQADREGTFQGFCSEYCGASHAWMKIRVIAQKEQDFTQWQKHMSSPAVAPISFAAKRGLELFEQRTCMNCHQIAGVTSPQIGSAQIGPDLTHLGSRKTLALVLLRILL